MTLYLRPTENSPEILVENGTFLIKGRSFPENAEKFFEPLMIEIENYLRKPLDKTKLLFQIEYANSATKFAIMETVRRLKVLLDRGKDLEIEYQCSEEDEIIIELFEELSAIVKIPFKRVTI